jgi:hypothetical protein
VAFSHGILFRSDLPLVFSCVWLVGIGCYLFAKWNRPLSKRARSLFLTNFGLCGVFLLCVGIPNYIRPRTTSSANACMNNLREIDAAANQMPQQTNLLWNII